MSPFFIHTQRTTVNVGDKNCSKKQLLDYLQFLKKQPKGFVYHDPQEHKNQCTNPQNNSHLLEQIKITYGHCQSCPLAQQGRTKVIFGEGNQNAKLMFIGEGPGRDEDEQGRPFIGRAGQLLTKIIQAMGMTREDVYISNVVKCRPPNNRVPLPTESDQCTKLILFKEIEIIKPRIICTLGSTAIQALMGNEAKITKMRGIFTDYHGIRLMPTYHPAYLLRNPEAKTIVWEDMKKIIAELH